MCWPPASTVPSVVESAGGAVSAAFSVVAAGLAAAVLSSAARSATGISSKAAANTTATNRGGEFISFVSGKWIGSNCSIERKIRKSPDFRPRKSAVGHTSAGRCEKPLIRFAACVRAFSGDSLPFEGVGELHLLVQSLQSSYRRDSKTQFPWEIDKIPAHSEHAQRWQSSPNLCIRQMQGISR